MLGLSSNNSSGYNMTFTIKGTYEAADGKFSTVYGNVALIDCDYILDQVIDELYKELEFYKPVISPLAYDELYELLNTINERIKNKGITLCEFSLFMIGVLKDQASYYLGTYDEITRGIERRGQDITFAITLDSNASISAPLQ